MESECQVQHMQILLQLEECFKKDCKKQSFFVRNFYLKQIKFEGYVCQVKKSSFVKIVQN